MFLLKEIRNNTALKSNLKTRSGLYAELYIWEWSIRGFVFWCHEQVKKDKNANFRQSFWIAKYFQFQLV